ncbi:STAS domain-containing protein [candidate division KSB1 bacterium]|nr:STAS domain-containing protein [candidate division KSB1 bacterium]
MELQKSSVEQTVVFRLSGKVMGGPDATLLNETLHRVLEDGKRQIVVDLAGVEWMNSSGLGILISALTTVRNTGGDLKLAGVTERIRSLLTITKLNTVFEIHDSVQAALQSR